MFGFELGTHIIMKCFLASKLQTFFSENLLKEDFPEVHKLLKGIISIDKVPQKLKKTEFVIINQSLLGQTGTHWCVLTRDISGSYEIFG